MILGIVDKHDHKGKKKLGALKKFLCGVDENHMQVCGQHGGTQKRHRIVKWYAAEKRLRNTGLGLRLWALHPLYHFSLVG